jgi:hypothetical protein
MDHRKKSTGRALRLIETQGKTCTLTMVKSYELRENSAGWALHTVTEWEFPSCGPWKVRKNG